MGDKSRRSGLLIVLAVVLSTIASYWLECSRLTRDEKEVSALLDSTQKMVRLLGRTSVVENGLRYGGAEVIEALLNRSMLGETQLALLWAKGLGSSDGITNTYSASGYYVGRVAANLPNDVSTRWSWKKDFLNGKSCLGFSVPVEHDEEIVGAVGAEVDAEALLSRLAGDGFVGEGTWLLPAQDSPAFSISRSLKDTPLVLAVPFFSWAPQLVLLVLVSVLLAWVAARGWDHREKLQAAKTFSQQALYQQALQVAHDIRSPVGALWSLQSRMTAMAIADRDMFQSAIRRIDHIAEDLLQKYRTGNFGPSFSWLGHAIARIVDECKAAEFVRRPALKV